MRPLSAEERALWSKVAASVRPLFGRAPLQAPADPPPPAVPAADGGRRLAPAQPAPAAGPQRPGETLDASWDRRLARGLVQPDLTLDLHGHTLASAHAALEAGLARAVAGEARLMLLVTGRPPAPNDRGFGPPRRGAIRWAVGDWLAASPQAGRIAAVRHAHPRHGGAGALYVVLRRRRG